MASKIEKCKNCGDRYCCRGVCVDKLKDMLKVVYITVVDTNKNGIRRERKYTKIIN